MFESEVQDRVIHVREPLSDLLAIDGQRFRTLEEMRLLLVDKGWNDPLQVEVRHRNEAK